MKGTIFYKKNYLISVYDSEDNLIAICDNAKEFAQRFDMERGIADSTISRIKKGERNCFIYKNKKYFIYFIELDQKEVQELVLF
jgi:hypothetical protein